MNDFCECSTFILGGLSDDQLKRLASSDICHLQMFLFELTNSKSLTSHDVPFFLSHFWFSFVSRLISSPSLVLRLCGWDVLNCIIEIALEIAPFPNSIDVYGASIPDVNGTYVYSGKSNDLYPIYINKSMLLSHNAELCCWNIITVSNKCLYNCGASLPDYRTVCQADPGSCSPSPYFMRRGLKNDPSGAETSLITKVVDSVSGDDFIHNVFGPSSHKEVISRSFPTFALLAVFQKFSLDHVLYLWNYIRSSPMNENTEGAIELMAYLTPFVEADILSAIGEGCKRLQTSSADNTMKYSSFITKLFSMERKAYDQKGFISFVLDLVWYIYENPLFLTLKNRSILEKYISEHLNHEAGREFRKRKLVEAFEKISLKFQNYDAKEVAGVLSGVQLVLYSCSEVQECDCSVFVSVMIKDFEKFIEKNECETKSIVLRFNILQKLLLFAPRPFEYLSIIYSLVLKGPTAGIDSFFDMLIFFADSISSDELLMWNIYRSIFGDDCLNISEVGESFFVAFSRYFFILSSCEGVDRNLLFTIAKNVCWKLIFLSSIQQLSVDAIDFFLTWIVNLFDHSVVTEFLASLHIKLSSLLLTNENEAISRGVRLLFHAFKRDIDHSVTPHFFHSFDDFISISYYSDDKNQNSVSNSNQKTVRLHPLHNIRDLKNQIGCIHGEEMMTCVEIDNRLVNDDVILKDILPGSNLIVKYKTGMNNNPSPHVVKCFSEIEGFFDTLICVAEKITDINVSPMIWDCINMNSTNARYVHQLSECDFSSIECSTAKLAYSSDILVHLLSSSGFCFRDAIGKIENKKIHDILLIVRNFTLRLDRISSQNEALVLRNGMRLLAKIGQINCECQATVMGVLDYKLLFNFLNLTQELMERYPQFIGVLNSFLNFLVISGRSLDLCKVQEEKDVFVSLLLAGFDIEEFLIRLGTEQPCVVNWLLRACLDLHLRTDFSNKIYLVAVALVDIHKSSFSFTRWLDEYSNSLERMSLFVEKESILEGLLTIIHTLLKVAFDTFDKNQSTFLSSLMNLLFDVNQYVESPSIRKKCFQILEIFLSNEAAHFEWILDLILQSALVVAHQWSNSWNVSVQSQIRDSNIPYVGLKNQGLTCYMNSLLQQLFMNKQLQESILAVPFFDYHRNTIWHKSNEELVGMEILIEIKNVWRKCMVKEYLPLERVHCISFCDPPMQAGAHIRINLRTRNIRLVPPPDAIVLSSPVDESAFRIFEQMQRMFCFLKFSKKRFFDAKPFVEACRSLNMNFDVFQQNDAAEFFDSIMDRIEIASSGKYTKVNFWATIINTDIFGGKHSIEKIPRDCEKMSKDCGLANSPREESFLRVEYSIQGNVSVEEAMRCNYQDELMDGDNKVYCDECHAKRAVTLRNRIGTAPNLLILHLKRFNVDFSSYQTVKLNSRVSFPLVLNISEFTKYYLTKREEEDSDNGEYQYDLSGILIHSGIAQGGHYYSYIRGVDSDKWYIFDDDIVEEFDHNTIPFHCFGGPACEFTGSPGIDPKKTQTSIERTANALLLFYSKTNTRCNNVKFPAFEDKRLVNGIQAFEREVFESNYFHVLDRHLLDVNLCHFVLQLFRNSLHLQRILPKLGNLCISYFCGIILHSREHFLCNEWMRCFQEAFKIFPSFAVQLISYLTGNGNNLWAWNIFVSCPDGLSRWCMSTLISDSIDCIYFEDKDLFLKILSNLVKFVESIANINRGYFDEVFILIRDIGNSSFSRQYLNGQFMIDKLIDFVVPKKSCSSRDFSHCFQYIMEAIASLLGIPQKRNENLVNDGSWTFTSKAEAAFSNIFNKMAYGTETIPPIKFEQDLEKIFGIKPDLFTIRGFKKPQDRITRTMFMQYFVDKAHYSPVDAWKFLKYFDYQGDLSTIGDFSSSCSSLTSCGVSRSTIESLIDCYVIYEIFGESSTVGKFIVRQLFSDIEDVLRLIINVS